jgi:hypothetical protein
MRYWLHVVLLIDTLRKLYTCKVCLAAMATTVERSWNWIGHMPVGIFGKLIQINTTSITIVSICIIGNKKDFESISCQRERTLPCVRYALHVRIYTPDIFPEISRKNIMKKYLKPIPRSHREYTLDWNYSVLEITVVKFESFSQGLFLWANRERIYGTHMVKLVSKSWYNVTVHM